MEAVKQRGSALQHASEEHRGDREDVMEAVGNAGGALESARSCGARESS